MQLRLFRGMEMSKQYNKEFKGSTAIYYKHNNELKLKKMLD